MKQRKINSGRGRALSRLAAKGRYGDTELVHVNKREAALLKALGGSGTVNPKSGLREFYDAPGDREAGANSPQDNTGLDGRGRDRSNENNKDQKDDRNDQKDNNNQNKKSGDLNTKPNSGSVGVEKKESTVEAADRHRAALESEYNEIGLEEAAEENKGWRHTPDAPPGYHGSRVNWSTQYNRANGIATADFEPLSKSQLDDIEAATSPVERRALAKTYARQNNPFASAFSSVGSFLLPGIDAYPTYSLDSDTFGQPAWGQSYNPLEQTLSFVSKSESPIGLLSKASQPASWAGYPVGKAYNSEVLDSISRQQSAIGTGRRGLQKDGEKNRIKSVYERASETFYPQEEENIAISPYANMGTSKRKGAQNLSELNRRRPVYYRGS